MDSRSKGLIATIASVILCGCPGLFLCIFGAVGATGMPIETTINDVSSSAPMPLGLAIGMLCVALIFMLIPVAVGFFTLRSKPTPPVRMSEPLPPAS